VFKPWEMYVWMDRERILRWLKLQKIQEFFRREKASENPFESDSKPQWKRQFPVIFSRPVLREHRKIHVPGLRTFKRLIAFFLFFVFFFFIVGMGSYHEPTLMNRFLMWIFVLTDWICLDYLWKTRHKSSEAMKK